MKTESKIQQEIVMFFRNNYCLKHHNPRCAIFSVPNEGRNPREQMQKKQTGLMSGVSDLILVVNGRVFFLEIKDEKGVQQPKQKDFEKTILAQGLNYTVLRSLNEFKIFLDMFVWV